MRQIALKLGEHEKQILLEEVQHRVKNNLQLILSLCNLQTDFLPGQTAREVFAEMKSRIHGLARVHANLCNSPDISRIDVPAYVAALARDIYGIHRINRDRVGLQLTIDRATVTVDTAVLMGMMICELLSSALTHAFPAGLRGTLSIQLARQREGWELTVADDGVSPPAAHRAASLGMKIVNLLCQQLEGTMEATHRRGTTFRLKFPVEEIKESLPFPVRPHPMASIN